MLARTESPPAPAGPTLEAVGGHAALLDPSGALFLVDERALVVADMHLEKGSAFARRGQMLPPYDTAETLGRLAALVARLQPRLVVALGDSLHDRWGAERLDARARAALAALQTGREFLWIAGNHDPEPHGLGGACAPHLVLGGVTLRHEPSADLPGADLPGADLPGANLPGADLPGGAGEICGHLHPVARVVRRGRALRRRCFVTDGARMVLPAFGAYTGGLAVSAPAIAGLFGRTGFVAHLLGEGRTYRLTSDACF